MRRAEAGGRVLAIGIDSAEPAVVRRLVADGAMPALAALADRGRWSRVESPAAIGSGSVWPTFLTGTLPQQHGIYGEWLWDPDRMTVARCDPSGLDTFLSGLVGRGVRLGLVDVPFAPFLGLDAGFELSEWGPHDALAGDTRIAPDEVAARVAGLPAHPFTVVSEGQSLDDVASAALHGVRLRGDVSVELLTAMQPDLALIVFTEIHHAGHLLWHTLDSAGSPVIDLYRAVDRELGKLVDAFGDEGSIVVFSLHGMRPTKGIANLLSGVLQADGLAHPAMWRTQSWRERGLSLFGAAKRHSPEWARRVYNRSVGHATRVSLARPTMLEPLDWARTRMFALPTDQHGWLRVNLHGRERLGTVTPSEYESLCEEVESRLRSLPSVTDVLRTGKDGADPTTNRLPDLVVHWSDGAYRDPSHLTALKLTGQHGDEGFCVAAGPVAEGVDDEVVVKVEDIHRVLVSSLPH